MDDRFFFFHQFLKHPRQVAWITPSSRFLERRVVELAGIRSAKTVVELGPGTGGTTRAILSAMNPQARLLSVEINPDFHELVSGINDDRLIAHLGNAIGLKEIISMYDLAAPEVMVSGIPFSTMSPSSGTQIIEAIISVLAPKGRFVAYQVNKRVDFLCRPFFGPAYMEVELLNIPPMRIYRWENNQTR